MPNRGTRAGGDNLPISHQSVEERVLKQAFESVELPTVNGNEIRFAVEDESTAGNLLRIIAVESLHEKGYTVVEKNAAVPMLPESAPARIAVALHAATFPGER